MSIFYINSVLISDQSIRNKIFNQFYHFRIVNIPVSIVHKFAKVKTISGYYLRITITYKFSKFTHFSASLIADTNLAVMVEYETLPYVHNIIVENQL